MKLLDVKYDKKWKLTLIERLKYVKNHGNLISRATS